jgi:hypothetical protein
MRRAGIVLVSLLVVALGLALLVDRIAVGATARGITADLSEALELSDDAVVRINGFPYLTQLMAGRLREVTLTAQRAVVDGLELTGVDGVARGVTTSDPYTAREARLTATVPTSTIEAALARSPLAERGLAVDVEISGSSVVASTTFLSLPVEAVLRPTPAGRAIALDVRSVSIAGVSVAARDMPRSLREALTDLAIPLPTLPEGLDVTEVAVLPEGPRITASGEDLALGSLVLP